MKNPHQSKREARKTQLPYTVSHPNIINIISPWIPKNLQSTKGIRS